MIELVGELQKEEGSAEPAPRSGEPHTLPTENLFANRLMIYPEPVEVHPQT